MESSVEKILAKLRYDLSGDQTRPMLEVDTEKLAALLTDRERLISALQISHTRDFPNHDPETCGQAGCVLARQAIAQSEQVTREIIGGGE